MPKVMRVAAHVAVAGAMCAGALLATSTSAQAATRTCSFSTPQTGCTSAALSVTDGSVEIFTDNHSCNRSLTYDVINSAGTKVAGGIRSANAGADRWSARVSNGSYRLRMSVAGACGSAYGEIVS